jgi:diaminopropionate ammonia-lyase
VPVLHDDAELEHLVINTPSISDSSVRVAITPRARYGVAYSEEAQLVLSASDFGQAWEFSRLWPSYESTPVQDASSLADTCQVAFVQVKHEGFRLPTNSFKVLGPPYALARQLLSRLDLSPEDLGSLVSGKLSQAVRRITACAATSGNHGRALAWAASQFGCPCRVYMPESTGTHREQKIQRFGAATIRVPGTYDASVDRAVAEAKQNNYLLVGDGARPDSAVLRHIVHGYAGVGEELALEMDTGDMPTHIFVPAGSGSLAAGVTARLWMRYGANRPKIIVVQAHSADAGYQSCLRSSRTASQGDLKTVMDGLSVRELSTPAWTILSAGAFGFVTFNDRWALSTLKQLAADGELTIGETGVASLAAFQAAANDPDARQQLCLNEESRVVLIATEGVTDPGVVKTLIG